MAFSAGSTVDDLEGLGYWVVVCSTGEPLSEGIRASSAARSLASTEGAMVFCTAGLVGCHLVVWDLQRKGRLLSTYSSFAESRSLLTLETFSQSTMFEMVHVSSS